MQKIDVIFLVMNENNSKDKLTVNEKELIKKLLYRRQLVFEKYPLPFALLVTFGIVATLYGFERVIDQIPYLNENPWILLVVGLSTLALTGTLYNKLK